MTTSRLISLDYQKVHNFHIRIHPTKFYTHLPYQIINNSFSNFTNETAITVTCTRIPRFKCIIGNQSICELLITNKKHAINHQRESFWCSRLLLFVVSLLMVMMVVNIHRHLSAGENRIIYERSWIPEPNGLAPDPNNPPR